MIFITLEIMVEVHDRVYIHSIFYIRSQLMEYHNRIYTWSSYISQTKQSIFTLGLEHVNCSSVFFSLIYKIRSHHTVNEDMK